jgi:type VI secretion system ImpM family protein
LNDFKFSAGYFGKLPNFPDFIKYNAAGPEILMLDKWIQEGILHGKKTGINNFQNNRPEWKNLYSSSPPIYFLFPFTRTEIILLGIIYPSWDKSGREFPFIIFLNINKNKTGGMPAYLFLLSFCEWFDFCNQFFDEVKSFAPAGKESLSSVNLKLNNLSDMSFIRDKNLFEKFKISYNNFITESTQKEFRERVLGDSDGLKFWTLLNNLESGLSFLRYKPGASVSFGVKTALVNNKEYNFFDIGFFINIVMIITGRDSGLPGIFIKNENSYSQLFLFFSSPMPQHFTDLFYSSGSEGRILNANTETNIEETNSQRNLFLGNPQLKLKEILTEFNLNK